MPYRILLILFLILGVNLTACNHSQSDAQLLLSNPPDTTENGTAAMESTRQEETIYVYICGEVKKPDVYALANPSRVKDAVQAAGGFTRKADQEAINLAKLVADGEQIQIPSAAKRGQAGQSEATPGSVDLPDGAAKVNLNLAAKEQLMTLPGIGETKAGQIIAYREEKGPFKSIEEIQNIQGIKSGVYEKLKDLITIN